ncbi:unnamed protein product [Blumeria hordei]|uniref:DUF7904 domain-containing protein n=1 Tax=Blumeria hordei TaxID=2867405 RepID=A0A383UYQ6_BLUHO|nr:unnamed protein product [Blumeria hordei]
MSCRRLSSSLDSSYELIPDDKHIPRDKIQATTSVDFLPESLEHEKTISLSHSHNSLISPEIINSSINSPKKYSEPHVISKIDKQALEVSDAPMIINDFFSEKITQKIFNPDIVETLSLCTDFALNIRTLEVDSFQISSSGKKQQVPNQQKRILFEENQYYYIHKFMDQAGQVFIKAYWWIGGQVPMILIEEAEKITHSESQTAGAELQILQQGKESAEFIFALDGIIITHRGSSHKYDSLAPRVLCGRKYMGQIVFDEVDYSLQSLCSGFPYLVSTNLGKCYLWKGKGSSVDELSCARLVGMEFGLTGEIEEIEDGKEPPSFIRLFNEDTEIPISASYWEMKPKCCSYRIIEITPFNQHDLNSEKIHIVDVYFEIFIIVGSNSRSQCTAFKNSLLFAQEYSMLVVGKEDRIFIPPISIVMGNTPLNLKTAFRKWTDNLSSTNSQ